MYAGLMLMLVGLFGALRALIGAGRPRRASAVALAVGATIAAGLPALTPPPPQAARVVTSRLDVLVPQWNFADHHVTEIAAPAGAVDAAIRSVTAGEIRYFGLLTSIRAPRLGSGPPDILHAPASQPLLEVATSSGFVLLADEPGREIVVGTLLGGPARPTPEQFLANRSPGVSKAVMNFWIEPLAEGHCRLITETRVASIDASARRAFDYYWRLIFPGSSIIRREWLAAIKRRAEQLPATEPSAIRPMRSARSLA